MEKIWIRYTHPTVFENAPYGTIWKAMEDGDKYKLFIQTGKDNVVNWLKIGDFFEAIFERLIFEEEFIDGCLYLLEGKAYGPKTQKDLIWGLGSRLQNIGDRK